MDPQPQPQPHGNPSRNAELVKTLLAGGGWCGEDKGPCRPTSPPLQRLLPPVLRQGPRELGGRWATQGFRKQTLWGP